MRRAIRLLPSLILCSSALASGSNPRAAVRAREALERIARETGRHPTAVWRAGGDTPALVTGRLSSPGAGRPGEIARRFLHAHPALLQSPSGELRESATLRVPGGHVVRYEQWHRDLPVFNGRATMLVDEAGVIRTFAASTRALPIQDLRPTIDALAAVRVAISHASVAPWEADPRFARLGLYVQAGDVLLAYRVDLPAVPALLSAPTLYVDAHDGRLLRRASRIWFAKRGKVYMPNPVVSSAPQEVSLPLADGARSLENALVTALNCVDQHETTRVSLGSFPIDVHTCSEIHKAAANGDFDFPFEPDDTTEARHEDEFAEVQMFYHVNRIYDFYRGFGFGTLVPSVGENPQLQATVNFRLPIDTSNIPSDLTQLFLQLTNPNGPLYPFDNAFFIDAQSASQLLFRERDSMIFGQGTNADFSYDGDVIYHEFGHAVVASTSGLVSTTIDTFGLDSAPGAMNEGYADYFSSALAGDPNVGEYAGRSLPAGQVEGAIRTLANTQRCPNHLWGEVHRDSEAFSGALWEARSAVAAGNRATFDGAVYAAMASLVPEATFEIAATATLEAVDMRLGADAATATRALFTNRGLLGCNNRIARYTGPRELTFVEGTSSVGISPYVPGYYQIQLDVPAGKTEIAVSYEPGSGLPSLDSGLGFGGSPQIKVLFARDAPIQFIYEGQSIGNRGDFTEVTPADTGRAGTRANIFEARLGNVTAGIYYIMLVNAGASQGVARDLRVEALGSADDGGTDGGAPSPDAGAGAPDGGTGGGKSGGCSAAPSGASELAIVLGLWLVAALRRRRRA